MASASKSLHWTSIQVGLGEWRAVLGKVHLRECWRKAGLWNAYSDMPDDDEPPGGHRWRQRCHQWSRQFLHQASSVGSEESRWFLHLPTGWWRNSGSTVVYHGTSQCSSNHECTAKCQFKVWDACGRGCNLVMLQYQCFPFSSCCLNKLLDFLSNALFCCALLCVSLRSFRLWLNLNLKALILTPWKSSKICANQMNLRFQTSKEGCSRPYQKKKRNQDTHAMATLHRMKKSRPKETLTLAQFSQKSFTSFAEWRASLRKMFLSVEPYTSFVLKFHFFEDDWGLLFVSWWNYRLQINS